MKLTETDVQEFLQNRTEEKIDGVTPVGYGEWSQAFFYKEKDIQKVIRFSDIDEDFLRDQFAFRYSSQILPIPEIEEIGKAFNGFFAISKKVDGEMIDTLGSEEMQRIVQKLMVLFEAMRSGDTSQTKGFGPWDTNGNGDMDSWKEYILDIANDSPTMRIHGWKKKMARKKREHEVFNQAYQKLQSIITFCPEERCVVHSDLLHFNLLVEKGKIAAVIDWGCAKYGDFLYDLAWFMFWQFYYPSMNGIDFKREAHRYFTKNGVNLTHFEERLTCYQIHIGLDSMAYCSFKENWKDVEMIVKRLEEIIK